MPRNYQVRKKRKYRCCIRIESAKENGELKLVLFIKGRRVEASQKHTALLACLHKNQGHVVSYKQLEQIPFEFTHSLRA
jgi:hypothetical protein